MFDYFMFKSKILASKDFHEFKATALQGLLCHCWILCLSQQVIWASFGHPNPQKSAPGHPQNFSTPKQFPWHCIRILCLNPTSKYIFIVVIWVSSSLPWKIGHPKIRKLPIFGTQFQDPVGIHCHIFLCCPQLEGLLVMQLIPLW